MKMSLQTVYCLCINILQATICVKTTSTKKNTSLNQHLLASSLKNFKNIQKANKGTHEDAPRLKKKKKDREKGQHKYTTIDSFMFKG